MKDLPSVTEGMPSDFIPEGLGSNSTSRAHHTIQRKIGSGLQTDGMTYCGLFKSAVAAETARKEHVGPSDFNSRLSRYEIAEGIKNWLDSTEVVELAIGKEYIEHGLGALVHGKSDGAHGSKKTTWRELRAA